MKRYQTNEDAFCGVFNVWTQDYTKNTKASYIANLRRYRKVVIFLPDKFDVAAITSFATIDSRGRITIPSEIIYEMFGTVENAAGTELRVHWNGENNSITLKKFGKNIHDDNF